tara:strand:+ start:5529 stop:6761 length:1233 start_codon:yes stop_codon:yes gene_type:complete
MGILFIFSSIMFFPSVLGVLESQEANLIVTLPQKPQNAIVSVYSKKTLADSLLVTKVHEVSTNSQGVADIWMKFDNELEYSLFMTSLDYRAAALGFSYMRGGTTMNINNNFPLVEPGLQSNLGRFTFKIKRNNVPVKGTVTLRDEYGNVLVKESDNQGNLEVYFSKEPYTTIVDGTKFYFDHHTAHPQVYVGIHGYQDKTPGNGWYPGMDLSIKFSFSSVDCLNTNSDFDGDGTFDCNDGCSSDPGKVVPGVCGCGVADVDSDGDGTFDCNDGCPNNPAATVAGQCGPICSADCYGKVCGDDGAGGSCGTCPANSYCESGSCMIEQCSENGCHYVLSIQKSNMCGQVTDATFTIQQGVPLDDVFIHGEDYYFHFSQGVDYVVNVNSPGYQSKSVNVNINKNTAEKIILFS